MNIFDQFKRSWAITKKDLSIFYLKGPVVISGLLMPSFLFFAFVLGRKFSPSFLIPSLLGMVLFVTVSSIGPVIAPWETRMRTFERLVSAPIALWAIILGDIIASLLFGLFITLSGSLLLFVFGSVDLSSPTDNPSNIMMLSSLIKFPLIFISGVFVPIGEMGSWKIISFAELRCIR